MRNIFIYKLSKLAKDVRTCREVNLEPVIQSDVSQKEYIKHCILMHIYVI